MPSTKDMIQSKYLKGSDVPEPVIVTIKGVKQVNVAKEDQEPEYKWVVKFAEFDKPMVLNATNIRIAEKSLGDNTDDWTGKEIELHFDENVTFGNELVGGLRFRRKQAPAKKLTIDEANKKLKEMEDDTPF
jgi:hypothetical protein